MAELPVTTVKCDGCGDKLNLLNPYLHVPIKAQREVLVSEEVESDDPNEVPEPLIYLGTKSGRGAIKRFHGFDCMKKYAADKSGAGAKLEYHVETEVYVPEDNPDEKEIARRLSESKGEDE